MVSVLACKAATNVQAPRPTHPGTRDSGAERAAMRQLPDRNRVSSARPTTRRTIRPTTRSNTTPPEPENAPHLVPATNLTTRQVNFPPAEPVPLLSAAESLKTFKLPPGFRIEVVASDP